ncbi:MULTISPECIES: ADP-ribosylglycohydrolase family protein [unclassified Variovorax]|uniref:ADP-ribosylglycohydrolase family protein n=1 Tax=unclassified Variovorax TaxID=663243 RepID=UPI0008CAA301|nr:MULTISPECIES: ADP-ribosylglycohydrolase family protein [unclassified Variovorax]SEK14290.1 ADP-ribosylglycohydrolase [Variovorax sp. OK202]SFD96510.1 ADP-ribosylglycohydrolase [Variovorax sp. OK212]
MTSVRLQRALVALDGLSVGDAFGQCFFQRENASEARWVERQLPDAPWLYTDDTEMSLSVVAALGRQGEIEQASLALSLARHYDYERAYGPSMHRVLARIRAGEDWRTVTNDAFEGQGSYGNGAAMRAAPIGAFFADDSAAVAEQAALSAAVTHAHPEGIAGAVAVALAAAQACRFRMAGQRPSHAQFLGGIVEQLAQGEVRSRLVRAQSMDRVASLDFPVSVLGNGMAMSAQDTVPFALWCCGQALDNYQDALWLAVGAGGDRDTLCAIVGGVVACFVGAQGIPADWLERREVLPEWHLS